MPYEKRKQGVQTVSILILRSDISLENGYLAGVYGGIPYLQGFSLKAGE